MVVLRVRLLGSGIPHDGVGGSWRSKKGRVEGGGGGRVCIREGLMVTVLAICEKGQIASSTGERRLLVRSICAGDEVLVSNDGDGMGTTLPPARLMFCLFEREKFVLGRA